MSTAAVKFSPVAEVHFERRTRAGLLGFCVAGVYAVIVGAAILHHEPWADEAQAWLLGRDASLWDLWTRLMHYEGSPGIWQTLVHFLVAAGLPYSAYNFVSGALAFAAAWMLIRYAPLPLAVRLTLPFTYYLCYQYAVVARSYALLAPLLFASALIFQRAVERPFLFTTLLCLIAGVSVHGVVISACIWLAAYGPAAMRWRELTGAERRRLIAAASLYGAVMLFFVLCAWPAKDVAFAEHRGLANFHYLPDVARGTAAAAFTGDWITSVAAIVLSMPFLWRGGGWLVFVPSTVILVLFGTLVYAQVWHFGVFFLVWLFAIWISTFRAKITQPTVIAVAIVIACQCYWTWQAISYDWSQHYSGSLGAAQYIRRTGIQPGGLYAIGYSSTAIQPYFSANLYSDFDKGGRAAYWDWSKKNVADDPAALIRSRNRDAVLVGYKNFGERSRWAGLLNLLGYEPQEHFDGATFWQAGVFESESFDLYRKAVNKDAPEAASEVQAADPATSVQLLSGFYDVEGNAWRWAAKKFSVALKPPEGAEKDGATLQLSVFLPATHLQLLGPVTLSADVDGRPLETRTFSEAGKYTYSARVPPDALRETLVTANFWLNKAVADMKTDPRELGVVVNWVGFDVETSR